MYTISILCYVTLGLDDHPRLLGHRIAQLPEVVLGDVHGPSHPGPGGPEAAEGQLIADPDLASGLCGTVLVLLSKKDPRGHLILGRQRLVCCQTANNYLLL